jgi:hypothetical protein|tara:strand:+ start:3911 stop:4366 length:456 start_codon:yes stop_codon:yes gene_type:complete
MGDIIIKMTQPNTKTYRIKNLGSLDIMQDLPAMIYALPESNDQAAIGIKVEGNLTTINVSWTLVDEAATVVDGASILTADQQMNFLMDDFQPLGSTFAYQLQLLDNNGSVFFTKNGIITKLNVSKSGSTPVTYNASVLFSVATMTANNEAQ